MKAVVVRLTLACISLTIISLMLTGIGYARIDPESVVGIWLFDEGEGIVAKDSSGKGLEGEIVGDPKWVDGKLGRGLKFGEPGNYVKVPDDDVLNLTTFTVTCWGKLHKTDTWQQLMGKADAEGNDGNYYFQILGGGETVAIAFSQGHNQRKFAKSETIVTDGKWHHMAGTYDLKNLRIYVDGIIERESEYKGPPDQVPDPLSIGGTSSGGHPVRGALDEIGIFNKVLSDNDIESIMTKGLERALGISAVFSAGKVATTWATIKAQY